MLNRRICFLALVLFLFCLTEARAELPEETELIVQEEGALPTDCNLITINFKDFEYITIGYKVNQFIIRHPEVIILNNHHKIPCRNLILPP